MHILQIDDHALFSAGMGVLLREMAPGATVVTATDVAHGLAQPGRFDLILLDLHLSDATGLDGLTRIRSAHEATPVVVVSMEQNPARIRECIQFGAMGFVPKSSTPAELFKAVGLILAGQIYLPPACIASVADPNGFSPGKFQPSPRQREVLLKVIHGKSNKVIARELGISDHTVKSHVMAVLALLGVKNRTEAVYRAAALGMPLTDSEPDR